MDHNTSPIGELIKAFLKRNKLDERMEEVDIRNNWEKLAGKLIAQHTKEVRLRNGKLILKLNSASLRHTLSFSKTEFIDKLNDSIGRKVISEIELR
jgi:predicted nucleic acid-binding Zn ribbon protein